MLVALRDMSIRDNAVKRGDRLTAAQQAKLPPGRAESLKHNRWVEEITDEQRVARAVGDAFDRLAALEARVAEIEAAVTAPREKIDGRTKAARQAKAAS